MLGLQSGQAGWGKEGRGRKELMVGGLEGAVSLRMGVCFILESFPLTHPIQVNTSICLEAMGSPT